MEVYCVFFSFLKNFNCSLIVRLQLLNFNWITVAIIAGNFDRATNPHPNPTDFAHEIRIWRIRILAGSVTSLEVAWIATFWHYGMSPLPGVCCSACAFRRKISKSKQKYLKTTLNMKQNSSTRHILGAMTTCLSVDLLLLISYWILK